MTDFLPRHEFDNLARRHSPGRPSNAKGRWTQFMSLFSAQITGWDSLRDITDTLKTQGKRLYHLGMRPVSRATLARMNEKQPATLYAKVFGTLLKKCQGIAPRHGFHFQGKLYLLDASTVRLCLARFPWAEFRQKKALSNSISTLMPTAIFLLFLT
jgi:hypothetical protein